MDLCEGPPPDHGYRILVDRGCFHNIDPLDQPAFVANVVRVSAPDARLLLILKAYREGQPLGDPVETERATRQVQSAFGAAFRIVRTAETWLDPFRGREPDRARPGLAYWLERPAPA